MHLNFESASFAYEKRSCHLLVRETFLYLLSAEIRAGSYMKLLNKEVY